MTTKPLGYGRYKDDPEHVGCPRANSDMTPCIARDGSPAMDDLAGDCVGCGILATTALRELRHEVTGKSRAPVVIPRHAADKLKALVWEVTSR